MESDESAALYRQDDADWRRIGGLDGVVSLGMRT